MDLNGRNKTVKIPNFGYKTVLSFQNEHGRIF